MRLNIKQLQLSVSSKTPTPEYPQPHTCTHTHSGLSGGERGLPGNRDSLKASLSPQGSKTPVVSSVTLFWPYCNTLPVLLAPSPQDQPQLWTETGEKQERGRGTKTQKEKTRERKFRDGQIGKQSQKRNGEREDGRLQEEKMVGKR